MSIFAEILFNHSLTIHITVKAPNIAHFSILTSVGCNKKETNLKKYPQLNKVIIIPYLHKVQNEKIFS